MQALKAFTLSATILLTACTTAVPYAPEQVPAAPEKLVERVLHEQATDTPPERVTVSAEFFEFAEGSVTQRRLMVLSETVQQPTVRVYYRSIANIQLYRKRGTWYVVPEAKDGRELVTVASYSEEDAKRFIDALAALRARAPLNN